MLYTDAGETIVEEVITQAQKSIQYARSSFHGDDPSKIEKNAKDCWESRVGWMPSSFTQLRSKTVDETAFSLAVSGFETKQDYENTRSLEFVTSLLFSASHHNFLPTTQIITLTVLYILNLDIGEVYTTIPP